ncbi:amidohydrolase family protein [Neolewinella agarilytica]|uniref:L-fuconolactonase n=1 Tax=Neolewinella agarilytica TaxID=478744 RepID=A0A1H9EDJ5_9BACT|nr:amidohydrolase family protein [Neolewinella agarilytica]SEQ23632.1 L-fuconolactonase [Neolewinella agarilytica]
MIIDSHQHFWRYEAKKHDWIDDEMAVIRRDFMPEDLQPILAANGVNGCVAVQADQTRDETDFLLALARENPFIKGVVGWIDLRAENLNVQLDVYAGSTALKGFRHVVQGEADPQFMLRPEFVRGIRTIGERGYTYDLLILPHQLLAAVELVRQFPEQRFVVDHLAKPYIKAGYLAGWEIGMQALAAFPNVWCKVSGMVTEADYQNWTEDQMKPYLDVVFDAWGTERVMFGSDWPVCRVAAPYDRVLGLVNDYLSGFSQPEQQAVLGGNCWSFYGLA